MGFLDNSGDIILDAVLTDTGRMRLARGDGSFRIAKFALGDDEIDYAKYDRNNASGSAYYDIDIAKTPVFEAFTNNTSNMQSKLVSINRTNLLYMPVVKLSTLAESEQTYSAAGVSDIFLVTVDDSTTTEISSLTNKVGILYGNNTSSPNHIRLDQGLDNSGEGPSPSETLDADLLETQYIVEMDNRFGSLYGVNGLTKADPSFIDDDNIASYFLSRGENTEFVTDLQPSSTDGTNVANSSLSGPRGTSLRVQLKSSVNLSSTTNLFTTLGSTMTIDSVTYLTIDTTIRVTGATTGYRVDVPVRYIKKQ
jgi:hypothetical protein